MAKNLIYDGLDIFNPEKKPDEYLTPEQNEQGNTNLAKAVKSTEAQTETETNKQEPLTYEKWLEESGIANNPELKGYTDERREKRAQYQQDMYNMAQALRSVFQGISGSNGSYLSKFENDSQTPRIQSELQRVRDNNEAEKRRVQLANWQQKLNESARKGQFLLNSEQNRRADERINKQIDAQKDLYTLKQKDNKENLDYSSKLQAARQKELLEAQTKEEKKRINDKYNRMEEYQTFRKENGLTSNTGINKPVMTVVDEKGKEVSLTQGQIDDAVYQYLKGLRNKVNDKEFYNLPEYIQDIVIKKGGVPSTAESRMIIRDIYGGKSTPNTNTNTSASASLWDDDTEEKSLWE